jgi:AcrR family transcriptional regulator
LESITESIARRAAEREVEARQSANVTEMQRIVDATYAVVSRTGDVDPSVRDILRAAGLSTQAFYRLFRSKDELMLVLLDDGRRRLVSYLEHRMAKARTRDERIAAWIEGVLAQASDPVAAERTRPFVAHQDRIADRYPTEQQASASLLVDLLAGAIADGAASASDRKRAERDAQATYHLAFGALHRHLIQRTKPSAAEVDHLVRYARRGVT